MKNASTLKTQKGLMPWLILCALTTSTLNPRSSYSTPEAPSPGMTSPSVSPQNTVVRSDLLSVSVSQPEAATETASTSSPNFADPRELAKAYVDTLTTLKKVDRALTTCEESGARKDRDLMAARQDISTLEETQGFGTATVIVIALGAALVGGGTIAIVCVAAPGIDC